MATIVTVGMVISAVMTAFLVLVLLRWTLDDGRRNMVATASRARLAVMEARAQLYGRQRCHGIPASFARRTCWGSGELKGLWPATLAPGSKELLIAPRRSSNGAVFPGTGVLVPLKR
jgi:hypothetical protein